MATTAKAQLIVNDDQKMAIGTSTEDFEPSLMVGDNSFFGTSANASIGTAATPIVTNSKNIGMFGHFGVYTNSSQYCNYGILGSTTSNTNGRNYGLCGMIEPNNGNFIGLPFVIRSI